MTDATLTDAAARSLRGHWFTYLDTLEPLLTDLHGFARRLTGNVWDAEDLVQDTLLRGFGMAARGDFHGPDSPVRSARAYLFRTATNLWLDRIRRSRWETPLEPEDLPAADVGSDPHEVADAMCRGAALTSARELVALLLKDVYAFTLAETADFIGTTPGTVKSALSRARGKLREAPAASVRVDAPTATLARAFAQAMNAGDVDRLLTLMSESVKVDVCNVGGGRGRHGEWIGKTLAGIRAEYAEHDGASAVLLLEPQQRTLCGLLRIEAVGGAVTRIVDYHYAPDTLSEVAAALGLPCRARGRHQGAAVLPDMIGTTTLPWRDGNS